MRIGLPQNGHDGRETKNSLKWGGMPKRGRGHKKEGMGNLCKWRSYFVKKIKDLFVKQIQTISTFFEFSTDDTTSNVLMNITRRTNLYMNNKV